METIFGLPGLEDYNDYFKTLLTLSGVLLGLAFTALIFVLQSGFQTLQYTRRMYLEYYVHFGRNLLVTLAYLTLLPLCFLFLRDYKFFLSVIFFIFALAFIKTYLDYYKQLGYIVTLFSMKFVPASYGKTKQYFRYIKNLGFIRVLLVLLSIAFFIGYPIMISRNETGTLLLNDVGLFYSTLFLLFYTVFRITNFIPKFFNFSIQEVESRTDSAKDASGGKGTQIDYVKEKDALRQYLLAHDMTEVNPGEPCRFLDGELSVDLLDNDERSEAWFNINVKVKDADVFQIRDAVCEYAHRLFRQLHNSMVDVNTFVLSFHVSIAEDKKASRNLFFRSNRGELDRILRANDSNIEAILRIENKLFDDLFRNLDVNKDGK